MTGLYKPLNEEDVMKARFSLLAAGEYDGVVTSVSWRQSQSGNTMADMTVRVYDAAGVMHDIRDFLVFSDKMLWKIKHFCDSAGLDKVYESGAFTPEHANNRNVRVLVGTKIGDLIPEDKLGNRPVGSCYPDKNNIIDYIAIPIDNAPNGKTKEHDINDDIPF